MPHSRPSRLGPHRDRASRRTGAMLTTEMLFILPFMVIVSLVTVQVILSHLAYYRVQAAAIAAADEAARGGDITLVHSQTQLVMGYLAGEAVTQMQYVDADGDLAPSGTGTIEQDEDFVVIAVRMQMGMASTNYLGLLGGSYNDLQIRSVVAKVMETSVTVGP